MVRIIEPPVKKPSVKERIERTIKYFNWWIHYIKKYYGAWFPLIAWIGFIFAVAITEILLQGIGSSNGEHTGYATAVEHNSNIVWASNIVYFKTDAMSSQEDRYCVNNQELKRQLEEYSRNKTHITVYFSNNYLMWKWNCNGGASIIYNATESR
jgi:hypothetical protein